MKKIIQKIKSGNELNEAEVKKIVNSIEQNTFDKEEMKEFLILMNEKKITANELYYFVNEIYNKSNKVKLDCDCVDICGTGGDNIGTFNISTASLFVCAGAGVKIAKHGNKAVSSKSGSFDVLEELGINIDNCGERAEETLSKTNIALFFAPNHHPAFKNIAKVRKEIGRKTIFNLMGPLLNPCNVKKQLIGVYDSNLTELIASVMQKKGLDRGMVVYGNGLDEITIGGNTKISELKDGQIKNYIINSEQFGIATSKIKELVVNGVEKSAKRILSVLNNEDSPSKNIVLLNSGAAIYLSGKADSIKEGLKLAENSISSKRALTSLNKLKKILN